MTVALSLLAVAAVVAGRLHVLLQSSSRSTTRTRACIAGCGATCAGSRRSSPPRCWPAGVLADRLGVIAAAAALAAAVAYAVLTWRRDQVKPLVFTGRAKRLFAVGLVIAVVPSAGGGRARRRRSRSASPAR